MLGLKLIHVNKRSRRHVAGLEKKEKKSFYNCHMFCGKSLCNNFLTSELQATISKQEHIALYWNPSRSDITANQQVNHDIRNTRIFMSFL